MRNFLFNIPTLLVSITLVVTSPVFTQPLGKPLTIPAKRIVCPNGNVQYTPCLPAQYSRPNSNKVGNTKSIAVTQKADKNTQIFSKNFVKISESQGLWEGFITGRGLLNLTLLIYANGQLLETRHIGQVKQDYKDKPTKFRFKSALPVVSNWDWDVKITRSNT